ncbi:hypothetical protein AB0F72_12115 [Actinoplanes sp. NPDC023936]|uniref:hypothetical protein n=1 Tax=Actinoplanes sp. NPDC023936 TaxID=3154910 RepID=UPI0033CFA122
MSSSTPLWVPIVVAAFGVAGSVAAAWLTQRANRKREDQRWQREREADEIRWSREKAERLRELRVTLYIDVAEYVQRRESSFEAITDEYGVASSGWSEELIHPQRLSARVNLLTPDPIRRAWAAFESAEDQLFWELNENPDGVNQGGPYLKADSLVVKDARDSVEPLRQALRDAMSDIDSAS